MENRQRQKRFIRPLPEKSPLARFVLALAFGLAATTQAGIAQSPEVPSEPALELELGPAVFFVKPDLLLVSFALRNRGTEPIVIAQRPGVSLGAFCPTESGAVGIATSAISGVACGHEEASFLELAPGETLLGKEVVTVPEKCVGEITVRGNFETLIATGWDLPAHKASISSKPFEISNR